MRKDDLGPSVLADVLTHAFGSPAGLVAERAAVGTSTQVYRVRRGTEIFYLRIAEAADVDLAPELTVHTRLRKLGVRVPEAMHYVPLVESIGRSILVTAEIRGAPVSAADDQRTVARVYRAAGRDLALINSVPVAGFDWIARDHGQEPLRGQRATYREFVEADGALGCLGRLGFSAGQQERVEEMLAAEGGAGPSDGTGSLAHGDLDTPHVFAENGRYTGTIDFGEIRGTARWYDLAEFALHSDQPLPAAAYRSMVEGYAEVEPLPPDFRDRIRNTGAMVIVHRLDRWLRRDGAAAEAGWFFRWNRDRLFDLLEGNPVRDSGAGC